jgi:glycogen synthase
MGSARVLLLASKAMTPAKTGGLADVIAAPASVLMEQEHGVDATILFEHTLLPRAARSGEDAAALRKRA